jgi:hypothetical protein
MKYIDQNKCPMCETKLKSVKLACPTCKAEFPIETELSVFDYLSENDMSFLKTFLSCRGSLKDLQEKMNISYPTAKKKLDDIIQQLGLNEVNGKKEGKKIDMVNLKNLSFDESKASDIVKEKLIENAGKATIASITGNKYIIRINPDGTSFQCDDLPFTQYWDFSIFDLVVDLCLESKGEAKKGNARNYRLGEGKCTRDTITGYLGYKFFHKEDGDSIFDPVFILCAILDWAGIAWNRRGYISLTNDFRMKISSKKKEGIIL